MEEEYIEEEMHELWNAYFSDLEDRVVSYLTKAIAKKFGQNAGVRCSDILDLQSEVETNATTIVSDFVSSLNDNLEEIELTLINYFESLEDASECYEEDEERWGEDDDGDDVDLGLDRI